MKLLQRSRHSKDLPIILCRHLPVDVSMAHLAWPYAGALNVYMSKLILPESKFLARVARREFMIIIRDDTRCALRCAMLFSLSAFRLGLPLDFKHVGSRKILPPRPLHNRAPEDQALSQHRRQDEQNHTFKFPIQASLVSFCLGNSTLLP
jgi:hypothetical protein